MSTLLDTKLNKIETAVTQVKEQYSMAPNASIDELNKGLSRGIKHFMNIFIQEEQPEGFEGLWIQEPHSEWANIYNDEFMKKPDILTPPKMNAKTQSNTERWVSLNGYFYSINNKSIYQYDKSEPQQLLKTWSTTTLNPDTQGGYIFVFTHNGKIYSIGTNDWVEFDPETETLTIMPALISGKNISHTVHYAYHENKLYCFRAAKEYSTTGYKCFYYDFQTGEFVIIPSYTYTNQSFSPYTMSPVIGHKIYLTGFKRDGGWDGYSHYFDTVTQTYGNDTLSAKITSISGGSSGYINNTAFDGTYLYTMRVNKSGSAYGLKRINVNTCESEALDVLPFTALGQGDGYDYDACVIVLDEKLYVFGGKQGGNQIYRLETETETYENNSIILTQGKLYNSCLETGLYRLPAPVEGRIVWPFYDFAYYRNNAFSDAPMYYGNGTEWVRFKN